MRYGLTFPCIEARELAELAHEAEVSGWDGVFIWDPVYGLDAWVALAAAAMRTERVCLGTMLTPPSRRRPWTLASQVATLDRLSNGRAVLAVGLGAAGEEYPNDWFAAVGEVMDRKRRAELMDESLEIITGLWRGEPFSYEGTHYHLKRVTFEPLPIQTPRPPIWVVGAWPKPKSMARAIRYDGIMPTKMIGSEHAPMNTDGTHINLTPTDIRQMKMYIDEHRIASAGSPLFDIVIEGQTPDDGAKAQALVKSYADAGVTWWLENVWDEPFSLGGIAGMRKRIKLGPPRSGSVTIPLLA